MSHSVELLRAPHAVVRKIIYHGLCDADQTALMADSETQDLAVVIRDVASKEIAGGLWGRTSWDWLTIEMIFVPEALKDQNLAAQLLTIAEQEALERGCHSAWLDTFDADAAALYESLGYRPFGELKDFPAGRSRMFLQKRLKGGSETASRHLLAESST